MRNKLVFSAGCVLFLIFSQNALAIEDLAETCNDCHGDGGVSQWSEMPSLAGLSPFYLENQMLLYQTEDRPCEESEYRLGDTDRPPTDMCEIASELNEDEIVELAAHFGEMDFVPADQEFEQEQASRGEAIHDQVCERCHSFAGSDPLDDAGILAGQRNDYLQRSIQEYMRGERWIPDEAKERAIERLEPEHVEALINYYAREGFEQY